MPTLSQVTNAIYNGVQFGMGLFSFGSNDDGFSSWKKQADYNAKLNYEYSIKSAKEMPSAQRAGLESAGYNPMLLTNGVGAGQVSNITGATTSYDANSKISNALRLSELINNVKAVKSQADLNYKQGLSVDAEAYGKAIDNYYKPELLEAQTNATNADAGLKIAEKLMTMKRYAWYDKEAKSRIDNLSSQNFANIQNAINGLTVAQTGVVNAQTNKFNAQTERMNARTNIGKAVATALLTGVGLSGAFKGAKVLPSLIKDPGNIVKVAPKIIKF